MKKGLVHIYTGNGKGKTTCAFGLAVRCAGHGNKVVVYQFLKATPTGEVCSCEKLNIEINRVAPTDKFWINMSDAEKQSTINETKNALSCDLLILDEIKCAEDLGTNSTHKLIEIIKHKPENTELVLTGRNMPEELCEYADYISEINCIKHPYEKNICAREGIEF